MLSGRLKVDVSKDTKARCERGRNGKWAFDTFGVMNTIFARFDFTNEFGTDDVHAQVSEL